MAHLDVVALFFAGALCCNSLPHLAFGLRGRPFPTPFATPRGVGDSPPRTNLIWGMGNLALSLILFARHRVPFDLNAGLVVAIGGFIAMGLFLLMHFGRVYRQRKGK